MRWAEITDEQGIGLRLETQAEMDFSALPYTPHELENAGHAYELPPVHSTVIRASLRQMGVGGDNTWGARTHAPFLVDCKKPLKFVFVIRGVDKQDSEKETGSF